MTSKQTSADKAQNERFVRLNKAQDAAAKKEHSRQDALALSVDGKQDKFNSDTNAGQDKRIAYLESFHAPMPTDGTPPEHTPVEVEAIRVATNAMINLVRSAMNESTPHVWTVGEIATVEAGFTAVKKCI